jgi:hypothetical protein
MDLKKLSPSLLILLGLACNRTPPTVGPCLSPPYDPSDGDVGPCLTPEEPSDADTTGGTEPEPGDEPDPPVGPCLEPPVEPPVSPCLTVGLVAMSAAPPVEPAAARAAGSRREALDRVLARATLPPDVAARLRGLADHD